MEERDRQLYEEAKARVGFKTHLRTYIIINIFCWVIWFFTGETYDRHGIPWPAYTLVGWGIGLGFHYLKAYHSKSSAIDREYEKLKNKRDN